MNGFLKKKGIWDYISLASILPAIAMLIYYCMQSTADGCFEVSIVLLLAAGIVLELVYFFIKFDVLPMAASVAFGVALGLMLYYALPTFSDIWNNVNFIGGNAEAYFIYLGILAVTFIVAVVPCFLIGKEKAKDAVVVE